MAYRCLILFILIIAAGLYSLSGPASGVEKLKYASAPRESIIQNLPVFAANEKGLWQPSGLEISWFRLGSSRDLFRGVVTGDIEIASTIAPSVVQGSAAGVPLVMISDLHQDNFHYFVLADSPVRSPADLKGARVGVLGLRTTAHAYGWMVAKALGIEKDIRFVSTGGVAATVAALKAKAVNASVGAFEVMVPLKVAGEIRELIAINDYKPAKWVAYVHFAGKDTTAKRPEVVRAANKALLAATQYIHKEKLWALETIKSQFRWSQSAAEMVYTRLAYSQDGRMEREALQNVVNLLIDFEIVKKEKVPPLEDMYTNRLLP